MDLNELGWSIDGLRGQFVVLDGPDGAGKTTVGKAVSTRLQAAGLRVTTCRDPGGTAIGDRIRSVLLDHDLTDMDVRCEILLFMASRAQLVKEVIAPALANRDFVLSDRFVSASCAYQVACGANIEDVLDLARVAVGETWPALTIILDVPADRGFERIGKNRIDSATSSPSLDGMERRPMDFHVRVRQNFLSLQDRYPGAVQVVDATQSLDRVVDDVLGHIGRLAASNGDTIHGD